MLIQRLASQIRKLYLRSGERLIPPPLILQFRKNSGRDRFLFLFRELRDLGKRFFETGLHGITS